MKIINSINYYSIGEVVSMKNVNHRTLRYYDEIDIFKPAYTNPDSNYRYYSEDQMIILDLILICSSLDIPLKAFKECIIDDNMIDIERILKDGFEKLKQKEKELEVMNQTLMSIQSHLQSESEKVKIHRRHFENRYLFIEEHTGQEFSLQNFWAGLSKLRTKLRERGLVPTVNQGCCFVFKDGKPSMFDFVEIKEVDNITSDILIVEKGDYLCEVFSEGESPKVMGKYITNKHYPDNSIIVIADVLNKRVQIKPIDFEVQVLDSIINSVHENR